MQRRRALKGAATEKIDTLHRERIPSSSRAWAPVTPNVCAFNSAALERLRITRATPDQVEHVWIDKDEQGALTVRVLTALEAEAYGLP